MMAKRVYIALLILLKLYWSGNRHMPKKAKPAKNGDTPIRAFATAGPPSSKALIMYDHF